MNTFFRTLWLPISSLFEALLPFNRQKDTTRIVPQASISGRALFVVITIMSFLASLTAASVYMINKSANSWFNDIASEVTVQINPLNGTKMTNRVKKVSAFLRRQPGLASVTPLSSTDSADLLEPWLGKSDALKELPIPRLIAVRIDPRSPANLKQLSRRLKTEFRKVKLDDHRHWQNQIKRMTNALAIIGFSILFFVALATIAIVLSATRAAMAANKEIIEVLHFVGAKQHFIAHEFEKHFLVMGIRAGLLGAAMAALSFLLMPTFMGLLGEQSGATGEYQQLFGSVSLDKTSYISLLIVVFTISAICMLTSRYWVDRILRQEGTAANPVSHKKGKAVSASGNEASYSGKSATSKRKLFPSIFKLITNTALASVALVLAGFGYFVYSLDNSGTIPTKSVDGIVALTGGSDRINKAVTLLDKGKAKRLLISGVGAKTHKKQIMRLIPSSVPLFNCCIDIGKQAQNTIGNAAETKQWIEHYRFKSLIIVTSNYHLPRAMLLAKHKMPKITFARYSVRSKRFKAGSWWYHPPTIALLGQEYLKFIFTYTKLKIFNKP